MTRGAGSAMGSGITRRLLAWLGVVVIGGSAFLFGAVDEGPPRTDADRVHSLAQNFGCPVCDGQSVAESDAVVARNIRQQIARRVDEGRSDESIIAELEAAFPGNDYTPAASGLSSLVWILPVVAGAGALAGLVVVFRRWRREIEAGATPEDERLVADFLSESDATGAQTGAEATEASADLTRADRTTADLTRADRTTADLTRADRTTADQTQADPTQADLTRADPTQPDERGDG